MTVAVINTILKNAKNARRTSIYRGVGSVNRNCGLNLINFIDSALVIIFLIMFKKLSNLKLCDIQKQFARNLTKLKLIIFKGFV